jgi:hypothetical protein
MSDTRNTLARLGATNNDALVEAGKATLSGLIRKTLTDAGITEAVGFEVKLKNGEEFTILSESNPRMSTPAAEVASVTPRQSARAGSWLAFLAG